MTKFEDAPLLLDFSIPIFRDRDPLQIFVPLPGQPTAIRQFTTLADWRNYVLSLRFHSKTPEIIRRKHDDALRVLFLAWLDGKVIKLAELGALAALEGAIKTRYPQKDFDGLESALKYLLKNGGVTDEAFRIYQETGMHVVCNLLRTPKKDRRDYPKKDRRDYSGSGLSQIRNRLAHGDPFEIMPWAGLFEVVRDLVDFMYPPPAEPSLP